MDTAEVQTLYDQRYALDYEAYYLRPWLQKHELNAALIAQELAAAECPRRKWLDLCCGQAWHFSRFSDDVEKVGIDVSVAQLERARQRNPRARFLEGDVLAVEPGDGLYDLVTCFWAAYCYLQAEDRIAALLGRAARWCRVGGSIYFEVLLPTDVASFNGSKFSADTGFRVLPRSADYSRWTFYDLGGTHEMLSPPLDFFLDVLGSSFTDIKAEHDLGFMTHMVARGKRLSAASD